MSNKYIDYEGFSDSSTARAILLDVRSVRRTQNLFIEVTTDVKKYPPLYSMKEQDSKGYISAYQIFMHSVDEYDAALKLVGSIDHWNKLCGLKWFSEGSPGFTGINQWRADMRDRDLRTAKKALIKAATNGDASAATKLANWDKTVNKAAVQPKKREENSKVVNEIKSEKAKKISLIHSRIKNSG